MAKLSSKGLTAIALVLSFVTAILVYNFLNQSVQKPPVVEGEPVVTARVDIPAKTRITAAMVQESRIPVEYIQPGAVRELPKVIGMVTSETVVGGEQVLQRRLFTDGKQVGFSGVIPAGKRALTVGVSEITGVAGLLKAGDMVDAIVTFDQQVVGDHVSQILLQNILVLAVNKDSEAAPEQRDAKKEATKDAGVIKATTVTLAVAPDDAAKIALAEEKGKLRFALRPYLPEGSDPVKRAVTPTDIVGVHNSPIQQGKEQAAPPPVAAPTGTETGAAKSGPGIPVIRGTKIE